MFTSCTVDTKKSDFIEKKSTFPPITATCNILYLFFPVRHTNERSAGTQGGTEESRQNHSSTHSKMPTTATTSAGANCEFVLPSKTEPMLYLDFSAEYYPKMTGKQVFFQMIAK